MLLPGLLHELLAEDAAHASTADPLAPRTGAFSGQGEARHFSVHDRRRLAHRHLRPQAEAACRRRPRVTLDHPEDQNRPGYEQIFLKRPHWEFRPHGQSGIEVSDPLPACRRPRGRYGADPLDAHRSFESLQRHAGHAHRVVRLRRPSIGSWASYGLGTENRNLPSFVVIAPPDALRRHASLGLRLPARLPSRNAGRARGRTGGQYHAARAGRIARRGAGGSGQDNRRHPAARGDDALLAAHQIVRDGLRHANGRARRFRSFARTAATHALYGLEPGSTKGYAWQCLVARG